VNLEALALVALLTGALVIFATQWLSVQRRRVTLALLRALGLTRSQLRGSLLAEAALGGALGAALGLVLVTALAALALHWVGADLGNEAFAAADAPARPSLLALLLYGGAGILAAVAGGAVPAWRAAQQAPALGLKPGDAAQEPPARGLAGAGAAALAAGAALAWLPALDGLPVAGYAAVAAMLMGGVLLVPSLAPRLIGLLPGTGKAVPDLALAQLRGSLGETGVSLAAIIVSFSLMVAMIIMVHSFRHSFDHWLRRVLPAPLQLRTAPGNDTAALDPATQRRISALAGVAQVEFQRTLALRLSPERPAATLLARDLPASAVASALPLLRSASPPPQQAALPQAWISEALGDLYGYEPGGRLALPLAGSLHPFFIAGVWRDYGRSAGAIVIRRDDYIAITGDRGASTAAIWPAAPGDASDLSASLLGILAAQRGVVDLLTGAALRQRSLRSFDRAFQVTYALEALAVLIGLLGVGIAASATALARRAQFGTLRHLGMRRRQIQWMFASEGMALSAVAVVYGMVLGTLLSTVLIYVIDRQSFHWSIDLAIPWDRLVLLGFGLVGVSALTALWGARSALGLDPVRAVREDW
jgi:putative ABC transport system permease protein